MVTLKHVPAMTPRAYLGSILPLLFSSGSGASVVDVHSSLPDDSIVALAQRRLVAKVGKGMVTYCSGALSAVRGRQSSR